MLKITNGEDTEPKQNTDSWKQVIVYCFISLLFFLYCSRQEIVEVLK